MPKRSNQFQRLAAAVQQRMAPEGWTVVESQFFNDKITGEPREVDVVASGIVAGHHMHLCIECRDHGRPADVTWIEQMSQKHQSLPTSKLVLWSRSGFTKAAIQKAAHQHIDVVSASDVPTVDWAKIARTMGGGQLQLVTPSFTAFIDLQYDDGRLTRIENAWNVNILDAVGTPLGTPSDLKPLLCANEALRTVVLDHAPVGVGSFWAQVVPPDGVRWFVRGDAGELIGIHRLGVGISTDSEHLPVEVASVPKDNKVITLATAKTRDGSMIDLYVEESLTSVPSDFLAVRHAPVAAKK